MADDDVDGNDDDDDDVKNNNINIEYRTHIFWIIFQGKYLLIFH